MNLDFFTTRKTIRKYKNKNISESEIFKMIEAAACAPTTGGMQLYSVVVSSSDEIKKQLAPCHFNQPQIENAAAVLTFCVDFNRFNKWCESGNAVPSYGNFQAFIYAAIDTIILTQQFNTIAEACGYGCCYLGTTTYTAHEIAKVLNLPKFVVPITTLTLGVPDDNSEKAERIPTKGIIHQETYHDYSLSEIRDIYHEKESKPLNMKYVAENGKSHLAQVFTDVRYTKADNEKYSKIYYDFIESQGFNFPR